MKTNKIILLTALAFAVLPEVRADYQSSVLSQSPVGYWRLNDAAPIPVPVTATNLGSVGSSANGSFVADVGLGGSGALPAEPGSTAAYFLGYLDRTRVSIPNNNTAWSPNGSFSVEFWAKPNRNTGGLACPASYTHFQATPLVRRGWLFYQGSVDSANANGWSFRVYTNGATSASLVNAGVDMTIDTNSWYHIVGVYNAAVPSLSLYVNGALATNVPMAATYAPVLTNNITITYGCRSDSAFAWAGKLDEPAVYPFVLSGAQILAHYTAGTNVSPGTPYSTTVLADTPSGYWRLNESYGAAAANLGSTATPGVYAASSVPGASGPSSPSFPGFEALNKAVTISSNAPGSVRCAPLNLNTNTVTMTAWVKPNGAQNPYAGIVFQWANTPGLTYSGLMAGKDGGLQLGYTWANTAATYDFPSTVTLTDGQWQFIALAVSPGSALLCAHDGTTFQTNLNVTSHAAQGFQGVTHIGMDPFPPEVFNGDIDEVAVFNRSLNVGEIYSLYAAAKGGLPPVVFQDPIAPAAIYTSETLSLSVIAGGTPDLTYQWRKDSANISDATNSVYSKPGVTAVADNGSYDVIIANSFGSVTSAPVVINVQPQFFPSITSHPVDASVYQNGYVNLQVGADGGNLRYRWFRNNTLIAGATNASYVISPAQSTNAGTYFAVVTNTIGAVTSLTASVTVTVPAANSYESKIVADKPISWWRLDETSGTAFADAMGRNPGNWVVLPTLGVPGALSGSGNGAAQFALNDGAYGAVPFSAELNSDTITVECWVKTSEVENDIVPVSSFAAAPNRKGYMFIKAGPSWRSAFSFGDNFVYTYITAGNMTPNEWTHLVFTCSPSAGWSVYLNGVRNGAFNPGGWVRNTSEPFRIGVDVPGAASYNNFFDGVIDEVAVYSTVLSQSNIVAHYEAGRFGAGAAPSFTVQPASQSIAEGLNPTFSPTVIGSSPITYLWTKSGTPISGATNLALTLTNVSFASAGNYSLVASNSFGAVTSQVAVLTVVGLPTFANLTNNLVLHMEFDGDYTDSSGRGNHGINNGATLVAGKIGSGALSYSTILATTTNPFTPTYVDLGVPSDLQFGTSTDFSVAFWFKYTGTPNDLPFFCNSDTSSGSPGYTIAPSYGTGRIDWSLNSYRYQGAQDVNDGNWHHIAVSFTRTGNAATYLDGVLVDTRLATSVDLDTGFNTVIGQGCFFDYAEAGAFEMDDLGVWRRALTANEAYQAWYVGQNYSQSFDVYGPVLLQIRQNSSGAQLIWQAGTLEQADSLAGPWTPVGGASAPTYQVGTSGDAKFYRVKL